MKALYQCAKIAQSLQQKAIIRFGLIAFLFKSLMYLTCQQQQKTWEQITPSLLNQHVFKADCRVRVAYFKRVKSPFFHSFSK